ncbi:hypothetical protein AVEN_205067-1 [Araneus ventricosus]|uniref:Uncharacterized protein n=1 Tax=Araneus ventricosus TaxID=182803 RepID=A0A4Y2X6T5_ARAVE|nr:hypothetical protein AVEN_98367-1 [Araneus ventricosus]GBO44574.1 hypothetical protein AVEN_32434-1 [Araneus ventricosus]GBO44575.1 hypothetical protein AVEN_83239-1 [Araneus ventricosus]GBO44577.1 hypothetical protein AVEN_205067-1 [Araneus ventricosus]
MTNWVEGKLTNLSTLHHELVVLPDCHLPFMHLTGTPVKNEHLIKKRKKSKKKIKENCDRLKVTKRNKSAKNSTKKKKVTKRHLDI